MTTPYQGIKPSEMSQVELDEEMAALIEQGKDDTPRYAALQRVQDRREKGRW